MSRVCGDPDFHQLEPDGRVAEARWRRPCCGLTRSTDYSRPHRCLDQRCHSRMCVAGRCRANTVPPDGSVRLGARRALDRWTSTGRRPAT